MKMYCSKTFLAFVPLSCLLLIFLFSSSVCAAELRIIDGKGLIRLLKEVSSSVHIQILASVNSGKLVSQSSVSVAPNIFQGYQIVLRNIGGLASDIQPDSISGNEVDFKTVPAGTWQISIQSNSENNDQKPLELIGKVISPQNSPFDESQYSVHIKG